MVKQDDLSRPKPKVCEQQGGARGGNAIVDNLTEHRGSNCLCVEGT